MTAPRPSVTIVPANEASCDDLQVVFGTRGRRELPVSLVRVSRDIVAVVLHDEHTVSDLARRYPMSFAAVRKHVAVLERAELVTKQRHGREQLVRGNADTIRRAHHLLDRLEIVWRERIHRLDGVLKEPQEGEPG